MVGRVVAPPEVRTTPSGTPVIRIEVDCGEGPEGLKLGVVMAGAVARELCARIDAGATVKVKGALRAIPRRAFAAGVEVLASEISEVAVDGNQ